jgi:SH3-like domain-containing protein
MKARTIPHLDGRIAFGGPSIGLLAWLLLAAVAVAAPLPQDSGADDAEMRTVAANQYPCVNLRDAPSYEAAVIGCIETGSVVFVVGTQDGWSRVRHPTSGEGWIGTRLLDPPAGGTSSAFATSPQESGLQRQPRAEGIGRATAERDHLAAQLAEATARIGALEEELTSMTLAADDESDQLQIAAERDQFRDRLATAEQRVTELESELASTRAAWGTTAQEQGTLATRVEELTAERDSLAAELTRSEARQLYLQNDLEGTRAELMLLKGIPPKLVMPEQEPEVAALPPTTAEPSAPQPIGEPESALATELRPELYRAEEVITTVRAWAQAWAAQRVDDYLDFYAPWFQPADGLERSTWEQMRRQRIASPGLIEISLDRISPTVSATSAIVLFEQTYNSDNFSDTVDKTLVMELVDGRWKIVEERVSG